MVANIFLIMIGVLMILALVLAYVSRPYCPKCKTKMQESTPHGDRDVHKCEECEKEWISL